MNSSEGSDINPSKEGLEIDDSNKEMIMIPNVDGSGDEDEESEDEDEICSSLGWLSKVSYEKVCKSYTEDQKKLEIDHQYNWVDEETVHPNKIENNILLSDNQKRRLLKVHKFNSSKHFFLMK